MVAFNTNPTGGTSKQAIIIAVLMGCLIGAGIQNLITSLHKKRNVGPLHGSVLRLSETPARPTSHIDDKGRPITKQQFLEPFVVPNFVGYSVATFKPGQTMMPVHEHKSLHEFFFVLEGSGIIQKDGVDHKVTPGTFLHMAPHEKHGIWIPEDSKDGDMKMAVCGVTVD